MSAYDVLSGFEPKAVVGNTGEGFDDPTLGFATAASIAISLKRIADALWGIEGTAGILELLNGIEANRA